VGSRSGLGSQGANRAEGGKRNRASANLTVALKSPFQLVEFYIGIESPDTHQVARRRLAH
jgi:hypothetical protein